MINYFKNQLKEIESAIDSMDEDMFKKLLQDSVNTIGGGGKIIVSGLGKNVPICEKFVGTMVSLGLNACFLHTNSAVHGDMGVVKDGDLVILLSKSGETAESIFLNRMLADRKISVWLLSCCRKSTLAGMIPNSLILDLNHEGDLWNIMPNNSTTLNLIILQGLAIGIAKELHIKLWQFQRNHPGGHIGELLNRQEGL